LQGFFLFISFAADIYKVKKIKAMKLVRTYSEFKDNKIQEEQLHELYEAQSIDEMLNESEYVAKPTRNAKELEEFMKETRDKYNNSKDHQEKLSRETTKKAQELMQKTIVPALPKGITIDVSRYDNHSSFINFNMPAMGNKEIASLALGGMSYGLDKDEDASKWLDSALGATYINYYTGWAYLDSDEIQRLQILGEIAKVFGTKKSKALNDYLKGIFIINGEYRQALKDLSNTYLMAKEYDTAFNEYVSLEFNKVFKNGLVLNLHKPFTKVTDQKRSRWSRDYQISKVTIDKIKPKFTEITWVTADGHEEKDMWRNESLFNLWLNYSNEGESFAKPWKFERRF